MPRPALGQANPITREIAPNPLVRLFELSSPTSVSNHLRVHTCNPLCPRVGRTNTQKAIPAI